MIEQYFPEATNTDDDSCINVAAFQDVPDETIEIEIQKESEAAYINQCTSLLLGPEDGNVVDELDDRIGEKED